MSRTFGCSALKHSERRLLFNVQTLAENECSVTEISTVLPPKYNDKNICHRNITNFRSQLSYAPFCH